MKTISIIACTQEEREACQSYNRVSMTLKAKINQLLRLDSVLMQLGTLSNTLDKLCLGPSRIPIHSCPKLAAVCPDLIKGVVALALPNESGTDLDREKQVFLEAYIDLRPVEQDEIWRRYLEEALKGEYGFHPLTFSYSVCSVCLNCGGPIDEEKIGRAHV